MAGFGTALLLGLGLAVVMGGKRKSKPTPSQPAAPSNGGQAPVDPWEGVPAPSQPVAPATPPIPSGGFGGPTCDPMSKAPPGFVCLATDDGKFYLSAKDPERFNPNLAMEAELVSAVVSEWINVQPMEIVLCNGTVRVATRGQALSHWLTQLAYWVAYHGLAGSPCPPNQGPEDLDLNPSDPAYAEQTPFRDSWMRLNEAVQDELRRRYVSDAPL